MQKKVAKWASNFTASEEAILMQLAKKYALKIECLQTDTNTNKIRNDAWSAIAAEFNSRSLENNRDVNMLRNKYNNLKKRSKKKFAEEKNNLYKTGGGKCVNVVETDTDKDMREIIGSQMTGLPSECDDDCGQDLENAQESNNFQEIFIVDLNEASCSMSKELPKNEDETEQNNLNWAKYTPDMLRTPVPKNLKPKIKKSDDALRTNMGKWASTKKELADLQKQCLLDEQSVKLKHLQEKHEAFLKMQERESNLKNLQMKEEHEMKMKIY